MAIRPDRPTASCNSSSNWSFAARSAAVAAHLHGRTGQLAARRGPLLAGDLVRHLPEAVGRVRGPAVPGLGDSGA